MKTERIVNFFFEIASLRRLTRSHRQLIKGVDDNISDHSFRVAVIGLILADLEDVDGSKVLKMCLFHDLLEARTGDANFINKQYVKFSEFEVRKDQMEHLPIYGEINNLLREYEKRESQEAIVAKDADLLDQMILQQEYLFNDPENRKRWQDHSQKTLKTRTAKIIAKKITAANPFEWLYKLAEDKTGLKVKK